MAKRLQDLTTKTTTDNTEKVVIVDISDGNKGKLATINNHTHTASQITDFDAEVSSNSSVIANTAKNSYPSADSTKLAGIDSGATADQTGAEIKAAYEGESDTNAFTDEEKTKLAGLGIPKFRTISQSFNFGASHSSTLSIAHGCSSPPISIIGIPRYSSNISGGSRGTDGSTSTGGSIAFYDSTNSRDEGSRGVSSVDGTNINMTYSDSDGDGSGTYSFYIHMMYL